MAPGEDSRMFAGLRDKLKGNNLILRPSHFLSRTRELMFLPFLPSYEPLRCQGRCHPLQEQDGQARQPDQCQPSPRRRA